MQDMEKYKTKILFFYLRILQAQMNHQKLYQDKLGSILAIASLSFMTGASGELLVVLKQEDKLLQVLPQEIFGGIQLTSNYTPTTELNGY